ncbi:MAG: winged helix-turn-helix transcriptional regulator [Dehalococcoidales bacterium]|nr:MAG: winged helix-turn-helix transcriptional regulator [Dehalococcoidales bacterium]
MSEWTFLTNHALVLSYLAKHPSITAREISLDIGITERAIRKIIADLDEAGYINKRKVGRGTRYRINPNLLLRTDAHDDIAIGNFLEALGWKRRRRKSRADKSSGDTTTSTTD